MHIGSRRLREAYWTRGCRRFWRWRWPFPSSSWAQAPSRWTHGSLAGERSSFRDGHPRARCGKWCVIPLFRYSGAGGNGLSPRRESHYSGDVLTAAITDEFVRAGKFLPAFLLDGTDLPAEQVWLPIELRRVLELPQAARLCFVLRVLEAWPRDKCATALGIPAEIVDDEACAAAQRLACIAAKNTSFGWCDDPTSEVAHIPPLG